LKRIYNNFFLKRYRKCGIVGYYFIALVCICDYLLLKLLEFLYPTSKIEKLGDVSEKYTQNKTKRS
jgi:hypothetical protein